MLSKRCRCRTLVVQIWSGSERDLPNAEPALLRKTGIGLTDIYNLLHSRDNSEPDVIGLRDALVQVDETVRDTYDWSDLTLGHGFHAVPYLPEADRVRFTISEPARLEILQRLSKLNRERYEAEQREEAERAAREAAPTPARPRGRVRALH